MKSIRTHFVCGLLITCCSLTEILASGLSPDFPENGPKGSTQEDFDEFAWQMFVAMNWPAMEGERGKPDKQKNFGAPGPVVWTTFKTVEEVFPQNGTNPGTWNSGLGQKSLSRIGLGKLDDTKQAGTLATLTDQNGNLVRYDELVNQTFYEEVVKKKYYNKDTLDTLSQAIEMPYGSMEVKGAWRIMEPSDDATRFYTMKPTIEEKEYTVGLVGLHLTLKTENSPQWIWATYEQVDNAPDKKDKDKSGQWSFYNPKGTGTPENTPTKEGTPAQITRVTPIRKTAADQNQKWHSKEGVKGTVWENYQLVITQWPKDPFNLTQHSRNQI